MKVATLFEIGVILILALSLLADYIGLAAIVGAFIAGLTMSELRQHTGIVKRFEPLAWFFTPFFFVVMGTYLDFAAFAQPMVLLAVVVFTALAVVTKYVGGLFGARKEGRVTAREVGAGMVPRGEVGIVVAGFALAEGAVNENVYAAMLGMVLATTILAPFLIKWVFRRGGDRRRTAKPAKRERPGRPRPSSERRRRAPPGVSGAAAGQQEPRVPRAGQPLAEQRDAPCRSRAAAPRPPPPSSRRRAAAPRCAGAAPAARRCARRGGRARPPPARRRAGPAPRAAAPPATDRPLQVAALRAQHAAGILQQFELLVGGDEALKQRLTPLLLLRRLLARQLQAPDQPRHGEALADQREQHDAERDHLQRCRGRARPPAR